MSRKRNPVWDDKDMVLAAIDRATTTREVLKLLGVPETSAQYRNARNFAADNNVVLPVLSHAERLKRSNKSRKRLTVDEVFIERSSAGRGTVTRLLLSHAIMEYICVRCGVDPSHDGQYKGISLRLDHINGVGDDNRVENLQFICPNCDTLSSTFAGRNATRYENGALGTCTSCGMKSKSKSCTRCHPPSKNLFEISLDEIFRRVTSLGLDKAAESLNTDNQTLTSHVKKRLNAIASSFDLTDEKQQPINYEKETSAYYIRNKPWPSENVVVQLVEEFGYAETGRRLGRSDNAVRKFLTRTLGYAPKRKK